MRTSPGTATASCRPVANASVRRRSRRWRQAAGSVGASSRTSRQPASESRRATAAPSPLAAPVKTATGAPMLSSGGSLLGDGRVTSAPIQMRRARPLLAGRRPRLREPRGRVRRRRRSDHPGHRSARRTVHRRLPARRRTAPGPATRASVRTVCGARCSRTAVSARPACRSSGHGARGAQAITRRPSARSSPTADVKAVALPPCALTRITPRHVSSALRTSSTSTVVSACVPSDSVPGKPACSPLAEYGRAGATSTSGRRGRQTLGQCHRDPGVGVHGQVRTVLFRRSDRDGEQRPPADLRPGQVGEPHGVPDRSRAQTTVKDSRRRLE